MSLDTLPFICIKVIIKHIDFEDYVELLKSCSFLNMVLLDNNLLRKSFKIPIDEDIIHNLKCRYKYFAFDEYENGFYFGKQYINKEFNQFTFHTNKIDVSKLLNEKKELILCPKLHFGFALEPRPGYLIGSYKNQKNIGILIKLIDTCTNSLHGEEKPLWHVMILNTGKSLEKNLYSRDHFIIKIIFDTDNDLVKVQINGTTYLFEFSLDNKKFYPCYEFDGGMKIEKFLLDKI